MNLRFIVQTICYVLVKMWESNFEFGGGGGGGRNNIILKPKYIKKLRICLVVLYALFAKIVVDMQNFCFFI
jgi:hypothetical protein